ncbi:MAG: threonine aldolase [Cyclobacteriaceae bacterium]|jgi:threonine aldolase
MIDLRSDTVTKPTKEMLDVMFSAKVGDDVFGDDPSVNALQEKVAKMFGMGAALFCPSGTMANQIALRILSQPQDEVICDKRSHIYLYEGGGMAYNSMLSPKLLDGDRGRLTAEMIEESINPDEVYYARTALVSLENTMNKGGGSIYELAEIKKISAVCKKKKLKLHLDGARLFNALAETEDDPKAYGELFDTISICFSKGLGAPVGSALIGSHELIAKARRVRKVLGGAMRQSGYLAAAAIYALDNHIERLKDDNDHARIIGDTIGELSFVRLVEPVESNIVIAYLDDITPGKVLDKLDFHGILGVPFGPDSIRFVTHLELDEPGLDHVIHTLRNGNF